MQKTRCVAENIQTVVSKKVKHNRISFVYLLSYDSCHFQKNHFSNLLYLEQQMGILDNFGLLYVKENFI